MSPMPSRWVPALLGLLLVALGCASLGLKVPKGIPIKPPKVSIAGVRLAQAPSNKELASYYCAEHLSPLLCRAFGPVPSLSDLRFAFDVELDFQNPNPIPLPVTQSLFAFTAFPEASGASNLGLACLSFCEDPKRCKQDADACTSTDPEIRDIDDFARAASGFLAAVAGGDREITDLRLKTIPPNDQTRMVVRLGVDPAQMVRLITKLAKGDIDRIRQAKLPELAIPYRVEGTAWVSVESLGRLATSFGPASGRWQLR
jgi:hypothetical protein